MLNQLISLVGALLVLSAYAALQAGRTSAEGRWYNAANLVGSAMLTWVAIVDRRSGFILLEGAWALLSVPALLRRRRGAVGAT